jgi:PEP-CTERM motif
MGMKTVLAASAIALISGAAQAQISFTTTGNVTFTQTFDPDGGVFASGAYTSGDLGYFTADADTGYSLTYLGQESTYDDGVRIVANGQTLTESSAIGSWISGMATMGSLLDFTFFSSGGDDVANGVGMSGHSSFALLGRDVTTSAGTFAYLVGYNDAYHHDDWDDFVIGINPTALVPEPSSYALLLAGLGVVGFAARRRLGR